MFGLCIVVCMCITKREMEGRETDKHTKRQRGGDIDREYNIQIINIEDRDREVETKTDRERKSV